MITTTDYRITYTGGGTSFTFPYPFQLDSDLMVIHEGETLILGTAYSVTGAGNPSGGTVTLNTAIDAGDTLIIERRVPLTQESEYTEGDDFPAKSHEAALDKLTMLCQQVEGDIARSLTAPIADDEDISLELPLATERALKIFGWDSNGEPIAVDLAAMDASVTAFGEGLALTTGTLYCTGIWTNDQHLTGDAKVYRFKDTGTSGEEWGIRSDGGKLEILKNTGTESVPIWTVIRAFDATGMLDSAGSLVDFKAKVSSDDTTGGYLADKVLAWTGMDVSVTNSGANETLLVAHDGSLKTTDADTSPQYLNEAIVAGDNITITETPSGANKVLTLAAKIERLPVYIPQDLIGATSYDESPTGYADFTDVGQFTIYVPKGYDSVIIPAQVGLRGTYTNSYGYARLRTPANIYSNILSHHRYSGDPGDTVTFGSFTLTGLTPGSNNTIHWQHKYTSNVYSTISNNTSHFA